MLTKFCPRCRSKLIPLGDVSCPGCTSDRHKLYDSTRRDKRTAEFYQSPEWAAVKQAVHYKYHGLCLYSLFEMNRVEQAYSVHHIEPLRDAWEKRLDIDTLIPLTASAHSLIEQMDKIAAKALCYGLLKKWKEKFTPEGG
ncbi:MAG TPA: HNH endonuclease [Clostridia bacterium]|nr:HNH endonuclease [Clostridia bacterium]